MSELNNLPFKAEYAKSGRASCKGCKTVIDKGVLRLAIMVASRFHDGKDAHWHHAECFFAKAKPQSAGDIGHFESLRWEDQEMIKKRCGGGGSDKSATDIRKETKKDYKVEYAKSGASKCCACEAPIKKSVLRIGKMDYTSEKALVFAPFFRWHHVDCFVKVRNEVEIGFYDSGHYIPGYADLEEEDKAMIKSKVPAIPKGKRKLADDQEPSGSSSKKSKTEGTKNGKGSTSDANEEKLKSQNKEMYNYRDILERNLKKKDFTKLLSYNKQEIPVGDGKMLDRLSDIMTFGALLPCKTCKTGQFVYRSGVGYQCMGHISEFTSCGEVTEDPERTKFKLPQDYKDTEGLESYQGKVRKRYIPKHEAPVLAKVAAAKKEGALGGPPKINPTPLKGFKFAIDDKFSKKEKEQMVSKIESFGGKAQSRPSDKTALFISTREAVKDIAKNKYMKKAKEMGIPVVSKGFVESVVEVKYNLSEAVKGYLLSDWVDDIRGRFLTLNSEFEKSGKGRNAFEKEMPASQKLTMKGGAVVEPDSNLQTVGHVLKMSSNKGYYNAVLNNVNIEEDKNSFYKMQVIESDSVPHKYWVFRMWGRIGTTQGGSSIEEELTKTQAIDMFEEVFAKHTGNEWGSKFVKQPGKYISLEIDYSETEKVNKIVPSTSKSTLPLSVQELICLIFDIDKMKETMVEFEIDMEKMPLGKISRKQILKAYAALNDALKYMEDEKAARKLLDASNRFFSLIPHNFGVRSVPLLDNGDVIKSKTEMLDNLLEIELAYELLREGEGDDGSVDLNYKKLNTDLDILENNSEEYKILQKYLENTHASTHDSYALEIDQVFKVDRKGEKKRYRPFKQLHNRKLLWHGSRTTNYVGILSQGLRIAPPEAPVTGYMFGKGIYFADMVSKSANYCYTSPSNNTGLLMLCEVALGDVHERTSAKESLTKPPDAAHSVKGCGSTQPDPEDVYTFSDGLEVPYGKPTKATKKNTSLLYNEYIVYDVAQVNIRYLLKVNFKYKGRR